jgi:hypothetical protein
VGGSIRRNYVLNDVTSVGRLIHVLALQKSPGGVRLYARLRANTATRIVVCFNYLIRQIVGPLAIGPEPGGNNCKRWQIASSLSETVQSARVRRH